MKTYFLGLVISILVTLNITSCGCNNSPKDKRKKIPIITELTMEVSPKTLIDNKNDIEVTFKLTENNTAADLSKYKLKATLDRSQLRRSDNPTIMYTDANGRTFNRAFPFEENVSNLTLTKRLEPGNEPLRVKFVFDGLENVIFFKVKFELLDANDKVLNEEIIEWKCNPSDIKYKFGFSPSKFGNVLIGINKTVCFKIEPVNESKAWGAYRNKLRLVIRQEAGTSAQVLYRGKPVTELSASDVGNFEEDIVLVVEPNELKETKFILELVYADMGIVATGQFTWYIPLYPGEELFDAIENYTETKFQQVLQNSDINIMANSISPKNNNIPLSMALYKGLLISDINMLLQVSNNLTINYLDGNGNTPLHHALSSFNNRLYSSSPEFHQIIQALLDKGADVNAKNNDGIVPLHRAVSGESLPIIQKLLNVPGINVNDQLAGKDAGNTPLHLAIRKENPRIVDMLLKKGARQDIKNTAGKTAVDLAQESSNKEIKKLFGLTS